MSLNISNLNKLIAHLEAQPPERINMGFVQVKHREGCGTCGCIRGHGNLIWPELRNLWDEDFGAKIGLTYIDTKKLIEPDGWCNDKTVAGRYPAHRVIATLKRLRDHFLATGEVKVDWGPEPGDEPAKTRATPQVAEIPGWLEVVVPPELPASITALLSPEKASA